MLADSLTSLIPKLASGSSLPSTYIIEQEFQQLLTSLLCFSGPGSIFTRSFSSSSFYPLSYYILMLPCFLLSTFPCNIFLACMVFLDTFVLTQSGFSLSPVSFLLLYADNCLFATHVLLIFYIIIFTETFLL